MTRPTLEFGIKYIPFINLKEFNAMWEFKTFYGYTIQKQKKNTKI